MSENFAYAYANEKFTTAVSVMASSPKSLQARIEDAHLTFAPIQADKQIPDEEIRSKYLDLVRRLTTVKDGPSDFGQVRNTLDRMNEQELVEVADLIFELFCEISDAYHGIE